MRLRPVPVTEEMVATDQAVVIVGMRDRTVNPQFLAEAVSRFDWADPVTANQANIFLSEAVMNVTGHAYLNQDDRIRPEQAWEITVVEDRSRRTAVLSVRDWGMGIPASLIRYGANEHLSDRDLMRLVLDPEWIDPGRLAGHGLGIASMIATAREHPGARFDIFSAGCSAFFDAERSSGVRRRDPRVVGTLVTLSMPLDSRRR